jgi:hypothetical protein
MERNMGARAACGQARALALMAALVLGAAAPALGAYTVDLETDTTTRTVNDVFTVAFQATGVPGPITGTQM